jgi:small redox-active disulfide protein 2
MLDIQVAGPGCRNCQEVKSRVAKVLADLKVESTVRELKEFQDIAAAGVLTTPGLIVNGRIVCQGKVPSEGLIRGWFEAALKD